MDLKLLQRLVQLMRRHELSELEIDDAKTGLRVRLKRGGEGAAASGPLVHVTQGGGPAGAVVSPPASAALAPAPGGEKSAPPAPADRPFPSPMVGTFYRSPSPEAEAFVSVGSEIRPESVLCIIEAMKVMNEIKAETSGRIAEILVDNGEPVEFGQPLFLIAER